jgi:hypothetical protein
MSAVSPQSGPKRTLIRSRGPFATSNQPQLPARQADQKMMKLTTIVLALMLAATAAHAEGPLPQPKLGATCPPGY